MKLQPPNLLDKFYFFLNELVIAFNVFAFFQEYAIVKKRKKLVRKKFYKKWC